MTSPISHTTIRSFSLLPTETATRASGDRPYSEICTHRASHSPCTTLTNPAVVLETSGLEYLSSQSDLRPSCSTSKNLPGTSGCSIRRKPNRFILCGFRPLGSRSTRHESTHTAHTMDEWPSELSSQKLHCGTHAAWAQ